ncbi:putative phosphoesterase, ICC [Bernardetia litoralis DSM 6794]|uniref:Putative phosphoesterase, ICC n=1 Tax=Bernardetia litoralis (strain ATCC 23117 / DSM 6794 / NBRC 15988 / NCIMB 1366 / Fx l1 / Sio-4) TaxID=880071 RepID=I4AG62_BERLS|nr:metallophosphoesterase [Bernardetia litoralis]AFM02947.1 putative phosphoesterase, ICC [Bernardetia litoralis DSM 6794]
MKIALFADLHGRILLAFKLIERLERERNIKIDLILQCGDLGVFPNLSKLDKATLRHAKREPSELGFHHHFTKKNKKIEQILEKTEAKMYAVRGNHEDHEFLNKLEKESSEANFPIDIYGKIRMCKTGHLQNFQKDNIELNWVGIGRTGSRKIAQKSQEQYIQSYEIDALNKFEAKRPIDLLISHDSALHFTTKDFGMQQIRDFLSKNKPLYHFFGHTGQPFSLVEDDNGFTQSCKIKELEFENDGSLAKNSFVILDFKENKEVDLEVISDEWINEYTKHSWEYL